MAKQLEHRGPDDVVMNHWGGVSLVFTRLSLTAPENGRQPFSSEDGLVHVIANGEIYNHTSLEESLPGIRLKTGSDCEVLLHLYESKGSSFLDEVSGMFSVVVVDLRRNTITLGRDEFGIKPLFHTTTGPLVFGSEIKTLFSHPCVSASVDWVGALSHPILSAQPRFDAATPTSWFEGIELVPAGITRTFELSSGVVADRPIPLQDFDLGRLESRKDFVDCFDQLISDSVKACSTADVGLGMLLSGGVDSVLVAALSSARELPTFSIFSPTTVRTGDSDNAWASAGLLSRPHHQVVMEPSFTPSADDWVNLVRIVESPQTGPEQYFKYSMHRLARSLYPDVKAMLLGAAADEYFGGYSKMLAPQPSWQSFVDAISTLHADYSDDWEQGGNRLVWRGQRDSDVLYDEFHTWKIRDVQQYNLWHEDRTAAAHGMEARVPYLDPKLSALSRRIPPHLKGELLFDKSILREVAARHLPKSFADRPKVPFYHDDGFEFTNLTFAKMVAANNFELVERSLAGSSARNYIDEEAVRNLTRDILHAPSLHRVDPLLRLLNLGLLDQMDATSVHYGGIDEIRPHVTRSDGKDGRHDLQHKWTSRSDDAAPLDTIYRLSAGVILADASDSTVLVINDGRVEFVLEDRKEPIARILTRLDGIQPINLICLSEEPVWAEVCDQVEVLKNNGIIQEVPRG